MSQQNLSTLEFVVAATEEIYRRGEGDAPFSVATVDVLEIVGPRVETKETVAVSQSRLGNVSGLKADPSNGGLEGYFYSDRGFVGRVIQVGEPPNEKFYVIFRGSDSSETFKEGFIKAVSNGYNQTAEDPDRLSDVGDWVNNILMGSGKGEHTQLEDALALTRAAIALANNDKSKIVVAGHSLGGGLSALVSAVEGVKGYAFAPAPFDKRLDVQAMIEVLKDMNIALTTAPMIQIIQPDGSTRLEASTSFTGSSYGERKMWFEANGLIPNGDESVFLAFEAAVPTKAALFRAQADSLLSIHTLQGEVLSAGVGQLTWMTGASQIIAQDKTIYDVGLPSSYTGGLLDNAAVTVHGAAIHSLVIRTEDKTYLGTKSFANLLKEDGALRYGLLENAKVSGLVEGDRIDPRDDGFGGSGLNSSGENAAILFRALWKEVDTGLYDRFAYQMGHVLSLGVAGEGKSATSSALNTIHGGLVLLGLQVVRDSIDRTGTESAFKDKLPLFGDSHSTDGVQFATLDIRSIVTAPGANPYGKSSLDLAFYDRVAVTLGSMSDPATILGVSRESLVSWDSALDWKVVSVSTSSGMPWQNTYMPGAGLGGQSHLILGGSDSDRIVGSSTRDYISAGAGNDIIYATDVSDVIDGGLGTDTVNFSRATAGVTITLAEEGSYFAGAVGGAIMSVENVTGSRQADAIAGNSGNNVLLGGGGNDALKGGGGHDVIDGGSGIDTVRLGYAFSAMNFAESMTATQSLFTFSPLTGSGWSQRITGVETFIDSNDISFTADQVRGYYQNRATAAAITYVQSGGLETSQAGDVFGRIQIAQYLALQPGESIVRYEGSSQHLDSSWDGGTLSFTLKASANIDLENWNIGAGGWLNRLDANVYAIVGRTVNGTYSESARLVGPASFQIIDAYDNAPTAIVANDAPDTVTTGVGADKILEGRVTAIPFSEDDPKYAQLDGLANVLPGSLDNGIRIWADRYDRDDVVTMRLIDDASGHFALVKSPESLARPGADHATQSAFARPYWTIVMVKEGLDAFSAPQSVTVEMTDGHTTVQRTIPIQIQNVNEAPTELKASAVGGSRADASPSLKYAHGEDIDTRPDAFVVKAGASGNAILDLSTVDPDLHLDSHTYRFMGGAETTYDYTYGGLFSVVGSQVKLARAPTAGELEARFELKLVSTDSGGLKAYKTVQVYLDDETPETRTGTAGNDTFTGLPGAVAYTGLGGTDTVSYSGASGAIAIDLHAKAGLSGWAQGTKFNSIETIVGTRYADTYLAPQSATGITYVANQSTLYELSFANWGVGASYDASLFQQTLNAGGGAFTFRMAGVKTVTGSAHADTLKAGAAGMTLNGGAGNDTFHAKLQGDTIIGGDGTDTVIFSGIYGALTIDLSTGSVTRSGWGPSTTDTFSSIERFVGTNYADTIIGSSGADHMAGGYGDDTYLDVGADDVIAEGQWGGNDTVVTSLATLTLQSEVENLTSTGAGSGTLTGNASDNKITALSGAKAIYAMAGNDTIVIGTHAGYAIDGGDGTDRLDMSGHAGDLTVNLGDTTLGDALAGTLLSGAPGGILSGIATLASIENYDGGSGRDHIVGSAVANMLSGGAGDDTIHGLGGDDYLIGGDGDDALYGGDGSDMLVGGAGSNLIDGGLGTDTAIYDDRPSGVTVALGLGTADGSATRLEGGVTVTDILRSVENVIGTAHDDAITGNAGDNVLDGRGGDDAIDGGAGNDTILFANSNSTLTGGAGNDTFVHQYMFFWGDPANPYPMPSGKQTLITDFTSGEDKIRFAWYGIGLQWENLQISDDGTDTTIDFYVGQIKLSGVHSLTANDFLFA